MSRRRIHIFLLTLIALFSCTDLYEKTGDVLIGTAVESEEVRSRAAVLSWDDSRETSMAQPGETVTVPACLPTPPAPHSVAAAKHLRTGKTLLRMPSAIVADRQTRRHHFPVFFAKAGTAFVSPHAANYYVFALRRMLC